MNNEENKLKKIEKELSKKYSTGNFNIEDILLLIVVFIGVVIMSMILKDFEYKKQHLENIEKNLRNIQYTNKMIYCYVNPTVFNDKYIFITRYNKINYYIDYKKKNIFSNKGYVVPFKFCKITNNIPSIKLFELSF